ncbi:MAG: lipoyl(octanoyl) transferase LipB [Halioglobus sp.]|nr:lipoyl(octanoyl) transferase LipB [Halioglobus sp.]
MPVETPLLQRLGCVPYLPTLEQMRAFTDARSDSTPDELWLLQHPPVFTQGQAGRAEHVLAPGDIPVVQVDRGGQVTYHGPGQWVVYLMIDLRRRQLGVRDLVSAIERGCVRLLSEYAIEAAPDPAAPGVYVAGEKIASLGLRVRRGCSYHGVALNVEMDLEPFSRINPCGFAGLKVTSMARLLGSGELDVNDVGERLLAALVREITVS